LKSKCPIYKSLFGKNVVVTGGATGIGAVLTQLFYEQGAQVIFLDINEEAALELIKEMPQLNELKEPKYFYCNLLEVESIKEIFEEINKKYGFLDVLCNNAADDQRHDWENISSSEWDYYQNINLKSQFFCIKEFSKRTDYKKGASIICMGSIAYLNKTTTMPSYTVAKAGIVGLVNTMATILGESGIRVNLIQPGWVMTEKQLLKWIDKEAEDLISNNQLLKSKIYPEDPAKLALFLASDQSAMITKQTINVDAGWI
tara:strand:+ start:652 stop:1425 length:774 start_codon:yes stop_codon:yes gene_type:complete